MELHLGILCLATPFFFSFLGRFLSFATFFPLMRFLPRAFHAHSPGVNLFPRPAVLGFDLLHSPFQLFRHFQISFMCYPLQRWRKRPSRRTPRHRARRASPDFNTGQDEPDERDIGKTKINLRTSGASVFLGHENYAPTQYSRSSPTQLLYSESACRGLPIAS